MGDWKVFAVAVLGLLATSAALAEPPRVAVVVQGPKRFVGDVELALRSALSSQATLIEKGEVSENMPKSKGPLKDVNAQRLRRVLNAARVVVVTLKKRKSEYQVLVKAVEPSGITQKKGYSDSDSLGERAVSLMNELPPLPQPPAPPPPPPPPEPAPSPAPETKVVTITQVQEPPPPPAPSPEPPPPPPVAVAPPPPPPPPPPAPEPPPRYKRHHPVGLLVGGLVAFLLPYIATVAVAATFDDYNHNAAWRGYIPAAGPLLARQHINDKDLKDGYDGGLIADGVVQIITANILVAGIIYCAVGEKELVIDKKKASTWRPLVNVTQQSGSLGAEVRW
jgi:hypothetical protein